MKEIISNNEKSLNILNKLILNGFYDGNISTNRIELKRKKGLFNSSASNHRIIGTLNNENKFELDFDFKKSFRVVVKIAKGIGIILFIALFIKGNWFLTIPFFIVPFLIVSVNLKLEKKKEIKLLTSKYLELYKSEYE